MRTLIIIFILCCFNSFSQTWQKELTRGEFTSFNKTLDSGFIASGMADNGQFILKMDKSANILWIKKINNIKSGYIKYEGWHVQYGGFVTQLNSGEYIFACNIWDRLAPDRILIIKFDVSGNLLWSKFLHEWNGSEVASISSTTDNGIIITGSVFQTDTSKTDLLVSKLNANGVLIWSKAFDIGDQDQGYKITILKNNNILITGLSYASSSTSYYYRPLIVELNNSGNLLFTKRYLFNSSTSPFAFSDVKELSNHDLILSGRFQSPVLMRTDSLGNVKWIKYYKDSSGLYLSNRFVGIEVLEDKSLLVNGWGYGWEKTLTKIDSIGNPIWGRKINADYWLDFLPPQIMYNKNILIINNKFFDHLQITCLDSMGTGACNVSNFMQAFDTSIITLSVPLTEKPWGILTAVNITSSDYNMPQIPICCQQPNLYGPDSVCQGDSVTFNTNGGISFLWNTGDTTSAISFQAYCNNYYTVQITNECGTITTFTKYLKVTPTPQKPQVADLNICEYEIPILNTTDHSIANWYSDSLMTSFLGSGISYVYSQNSAGTYPVYCTHVINGCKSELSGATIFIQQATPASFTANPESGREPLPVNFYQSTSADSIRWIFGDGIVSAEHDAQHIYTQGDYQASLITYTNGCTDTVTKLIHVTDPFFINIPNVFTPNGDGNNDIFFIEAGEVSEVNLEIFNRWGEKIFESNDLRRAWTGVSEVDGTYYYILNYRQKDKNFSKDGFVSLIR